MKHEQLKQMLVDAIKMLERQEIIDFNGHYSARIPGTDYILINSGKSVRSCLTIEDIVTIDLNGQLVDGTDVPPMEFHIHTEIYKRRSDVHSIVHGHPKWSTFFSMTQVPIQPVFAQGCLLGDIPFFSKVSSVNTKELGEQLATTLGAHRSVLLKSHGVVVVGSDILESFVLAVYLEENAYRQYTAMQIGKPYVFIREEIEASEKNLWKKNLFQKAWDYYRSKL